MTVSKKWFSFLFIFSIAGIFQSSLAIPPFVLLDDYYSMRSNNTKHFCMLENDMLPVGFYTINILHIERGSTDPDMSETGMSGLTCFKFRPEDDGTAIITYEVCYPYSYLGCKTAKIYIKVYDGSVPEPTANQDIIYTQVNKSVTCQLDQNDFHGSGDFTIFRSPRNGTALWTSTKGQINYTPNTNFVGKDSLQYKIKDGSKESYAYVYIFVGTGNALPVVSNFSKNGSEDNAIEFETSDFTNRFSDADNSDDLQKIKIISLPLNGSLRLISQNISVNQEINRSDLRNLRYMPNSNFNGGDSFTWKGSDGSDYSLLSATVSITIAPVNDRPVISNVAIIIDEDIPYTFEISDFIRSYSDSDKDELVSIKIMGLPTKGFLKAGANAVTQNQTILKNDITKLTYTPQTNYFGNDAFSWQASDGTAFSANSSSVSITINPVNDLPQIQDFSITATEDTMVEFLSQNFINNYLDNDNEPLKSIRILSVPSNGSFRLGNNQVSQGLEIPVSDISRLNFMPALNFAGSTSFTWSASDGIAFSAGSAKTTIIFSPVNDQPFMENSLGETVETILLEAYENQNLVVCLILTDPDQDIISITKILSQPAHGTIKNVNPENYCFIYEVEKDFYGEDVVQVEFCDSGTPRLCNRGTVNIKVNQVNDPPLYFYEGARIEAINVITEREVPVNVCWEVKDPEGIGLKEPTVTETPKNGTLGQLTRSTSCITYTPSKRFSGSDKAVVEYCDLQNPTACRQLVLNFEVTPWDPVIAYEVLTPNGDSQNQAWYLDGIEKYNDNSIYIYNRWGSLVYQVHGYNNDNKVWKGDSNVSGTMGSRFLPDGTYYYLIDLGDGSKPLSGFVVLKR